jgi:RNA polymerase sigma-70 factor (ECF subfamily)
VAASFAVGPHEGLRLVEGMAGTGALEQYAPFHLARADMLRRLGRRDEARECYGRALLRAQNEQVRRFIERQVHDADHREHLMLEGFWDEPLTRWR